MAAIGRGCDLEERNVYLQTPLHLAASQPTTIKILLEHRANPNVFNNKRRLPLHYAILGVLADVKQLIQYVKFRCGKHSNQVTVMVQVED